MVSTALAGLGAGLSLIVAIGAQNAFVLRQGILRERIGVVVAICALSDLLLIALGTLGIGVIVTKVPVGLTILRYGGATYLVWFGVHSFSSALRPGTLHQADRGAHSLKSVVLTTLSLTYLNPHVYLDTVLMLGNLANQHRDRWAFSAGAGTGSVIWFSGLGFGARALSGPLGRPGTWRVLDTLIGLVMVALAIKLALG